LSFAIILLLTNTLMLVIVSASYTADNATITF